MVHFHDLLVSLLFVFPPLSPTYLHPSPSFIMSMNSVSREKKPSTTTSKPANSGTHAPHDINLSEDPQNILPEDAQQAKKGSHKQIAIGKYKMTPIGPLLMYCIQMLRRDRSSLQHYRRRSRSFKRLIGSWKKIKTSYILDPWLTNLSIDNSVPATNPDDDYESEEVDGPPKLGYFAASVSGVWWLMPH